MEKWTTNPVPWDHHLGVTDKTVSKWENGKDSGYAILAELVNAVQNRPNAVYTGACFFFAC